MEDYIWKLEYRCVPVAPWPRPLPVVKGSLGPGLLSSVFLHRKSGIALNSDVCIYFRYFDMFPGIFLAIMLA